MQLQALIMNKYNVIYPHEFTLCLLDLKLLAGSGRFDAYTSLHLLSADCRGKPASRSGPSELAQHQRPGHEGFLGFLFPPGSGRQVPRLPEPV